MNTPVTPTSPSSPTSATSSIPQMPPVTASGPSASMMGGSKTAPKKKFSLPMIFGGLVLLLVIVGGAVGLYLSQRQQDIRQQASTGYACTADQVEVNGVCVNPDTGTISPGSNDCPLGQVIVNGVCTQGGLSGQQDSGYGCAANQVQVNGVCVDEPTSTGTGTGGTTSTNNTGGSGIAGAVGNIGAALSNAGQGVSCISACNNDSTCINNCSNQYSLGAQASGTGLVATIQKSLAECRANNSDCVSQIQGMLNSSSSPSSNDSYITSCSSKCSQNDSACLLNCARNVVVNGSSNIVGAAASRVVELQGCNSDDLFKLNCTGKQTAQCVNKKAVCADSKNNSGNISSNGGIKCIELTSQNNAGQNVTQTVCKVIGTSCTGDLTASTYACSGGLKGAQCSSGTPSTSLTKPGDYIIPAIINPGSSSFSSDGCTGVQIDLGRYGSNDSASGGFCGSLSFEMGKGCSFLTYSTPTPITFSQSPNPNTQTPGTGGGSSNPPNNPPGTQPPASTPPGTYACDSYCTANSQCTGVNSSYTCSNNRCRLASNINSATCSPAEPGPVCLNLTVSKSNPVKGDTVTFTCGQVSGATKYEFRVQLPNGQIRNLNAASSGSNVSRSFRIDDSGNHKAQCRICTGTNGGNCQAYESL